jgi:hypothetical protein
MSCSPVKIIGVGASVSVTPQGSPLLIANLQADPSALPANDQIWASCHTDDSTAIIYPNMYEGYDPVIRAPKALNLVPFPGGENLVCASNNSNTVKALQRGLQSRAFQSGVQSKTIP